MMETAPETHPTADSTRRRVDAILTNRDHEGAHWDEDALLAEFVRMVAQGARGTRPVAVELVRLLDAGRTKWYA